MLRTPLTRTLSLGAPSRVFAVVRTSASAATPAKIPEKIEVFVDDQSVFVDPGTTVLQVNFNEDFPAIIFNVIQKTLQLTGCSTDWC